MFICLECFNSVKRCIVVAAAAVANSKTENNTTVYLNLMFLLDAICVFLSTFSLSYAKTVEQNKFAFEFDLNQKKVNERTRMVLHMSTSALFPLSENCLTIRNNWFWQLYSQTQKKTEHQTKSAQLENSYHNSSQFRDYKQRRVTWVFVHSKQNKTKQKPNTMRTKRMHKLVFDGEAFSQFKCMTLVLQRFLLPLLLLIRVISCANYKLHIHARQERNWLTCVSMHSASLKRAKWTARKKREFE